jgi:hypothetical protein
VFRQAGWRSRAHLAIIRGDPYRRLTSWQRVEHPWFGDLPPSPRGRGAVPGSLLRELGRVRGLGSHSRSADGMLR